MYDPSAISASSTPAPPPIPYWSQNTQYHPGVIVWHAGTYWRCEAQDETDFVSGSPDVNLLLWTPICSTSPYGISADYEAFKQRSQPNHLGSINNWSQPPSAPGPFTSQTDIIAPTPRSYGKAPESQEDTHDSDDSYPDSDGTVTASSSKSRSGGTGMSTAQFFSSKADESMRFLTARQEAGKTLEEKEWKDELQGKRVWRIGGIGMWAYGEEDRKAEVWREWNGLGKGREDWLEVARARTEFYNQARGIKPLVTWKLVQPSTNHTFPRDALQIGHEGTGQPLFAARAWHEGGLHLGKAGPHLFKRCSISYGGGEVTLDTFEVLCAKPDPTLLKWMCFNHGETLGVQGWQPVEGGRERDGQSMFVAKGEWEGGEHPGKCRIPDDHAHVGWGGGEVWLRPFYVLAYASSSRR